MENIISHVVGNYVTDPPIYAVIQFHKNSGENHDVRILYVTNDYEKAEKAFNDPPKTTFSDGHLVLTRVGMWEDVKRQVRSFTTED